MFEYFPDNYPWSLAVLMSLAQGGQISEIDDACRDLVGLQSGGPDADAAWTESWLRVARRAEAQARADQEVGHLLSAGSKLKRAALYQIMAERMLPIASDGHVELYREAVELFKEAVELCGEPVEYVTLDTGHGPVAAIYVPAPEGPAPAVITVNGFDAFKEFFYLGDLARALSRRGMSALLVDQPGVGETLRMHGLHHRHDVEVTVGAGIDWLEGHAGVDATRVGLIGPSLGGYYGVRAAAREPRLACTAVYGAVWDFGAKVRRHVEGARDAEQSSVPQFIESVKWFFGVSTVEEALAATSRYTVRDIIGEVTCPLLIVHGEDDRQVAVEDARRVHAGAVNARELELRVFTRQEGSSQHCGIDNPSLQIEYIADWLADQLRAGPVPAR